VHSNSWGRVCKKQDGQFQQFGYTLAAKEIDEFVWGHKDMVICFAAGNEGTQANNSANPANNGHIGAYAAAKNCLTVGASQSRLSNEDLGNPEVVAAFSSRGPTKEGRCKSDVVAPGTWIISANSGKVLKPKNPHNDPNLCYMSGTSMATPLVSGCAAVLREVLISSQDISEVSAALIKALLINGAEILTSTAPKFVPSYDSGFGRVNFTNSLSVANRLERTFLRESDTERWLPCNILVKPNTNLRATLVWSDPPGPMIVNRLLLVLCHGSSQERPSRNVNNVQQVIWNNISSEEITMTVKIESRLERPPQPFAIVWRLY
jgi:serine protease AprX